MRTYIGIDNGISGSIAILRENEKPLFFETPTINQQDYTKSKQKISRLDCNMFYKILDLVDESNAIAVIERPMVNPTRFKATKSALRCLEATLICLETRGIAYQFIDSKEWQKYFLPKGTLKEELKSMSMDIGIRLFPMLSDSIKKQKDADSLLIAKYSQIKNS